MNSFSSKDTLLVANEQYIFFNLQKAESSLHFSLAKMPFTIKIVLENLLRNEDGIAVKKTDIQKLVELYKENSNNHDLHNFQEEIAFFPSRILMQDFTGVPGIVDLATMRDAVRDIGFEPSIINPLINVDLIIDHSVQVDKYKNDEAFAENVKYEFDRNKERYAFLNWGQRSFNNFRVVPPGTGICHQINLEYLAKVVWQKRVNNENVIYPDSVVGTDSHTTMINGLGVLGWGVGGLEAESAMLGQPLSMLLPKVLGFKLTGKLKEGITGTDLVLTITQILRKKGVVGKFIEFFGEGLRHLSIADRATISNMCPEYGATCAIFPIDHRTIEYLELTNRPKELLDLVKIYSKEQTLWLDYEDKSKVNGESVVYDEIIELNIETVERSIAGPRRPQDRVNLNDIQKEFISSLSELNLNRDNELKKFNVKGKDYTISNGSIVIAAITSCTNTSNPVLMIGAGLIAKKANALGLKSQPWVKTSFAPGSQAVTEYLKKADLLKELEAVGFFIVAYGCTTCIGNSGPLDKEIAEVIEKEQLVVASVLSGNRNFEGRIHPLVRANYLASPMLCLIYAIAGTIEINLDTDPIGNDKNGKAVFMRDVWPSNAEIEDTIESVVTREVFAEKYSDVFKGNKEWNEMSKEDKSGVNYQWEAQSTYIRKPTYFDALVEICRDNGKNTLKEDEISLSKLRNVENARILAIFGDNITTDHISPAGAISLKSPAADYLREHGVTEADFNSYGSRRGNHEVMVRGTFANIRIKNKMMNGVEGGLTKHYPSGKICSIYEAATLYQNNNKPVVVFGGKDYGMGSSRDWAAKGPFLLGVKAIIAESFERIHRSNLVGIGILPLIFKDSITTESLKLDGSEVVSIVGIDNNIKPKSTVKCIIIKENKLIHELDLICMIDTVLELEYLKHGNILQFVMAKLV